MFFLIFNIVLVFGINVLGDICNDFVICMDKILFSFCIKMCGES